MRHINQLVALDRVRQAPVDASTHSRAVLAELGDHRLLAFLNDEKAGPQPHQDASSHQNASTNIAHEGGYLRALSTSTKVSIARATRTAPCALVAKHLAQLAVEVAPEFIQIRGALVCAALPCSGALGGLRRLGLLRLVRRLLAIILWPGISCLTRRILVGAPPTRVIQVVNSLGLLGLPRPTQCIFFHGHDLIVPKVKFKLRIHPLMTRVNHGDRVRDRPRLLTRSVHAQPALDAAKASPDRFER